jgi:hypothetical protein
MAFPGFLNWWATSRQKRLTDRHSRYNECTPPSGSERVERKLTKIPKGSFRTIRKQP